MKYQEKFNPLEGFDYSVLKDPEYLEDSVREDIITPLLKALGYSPSGPNKMIRSRKLEHPYIQIGSQKKKISIVPDYILEIGGKPQVIVEAKKPGAKIVKSHHTEQAYSYAVHFEVRAKYFILCNGDEFVLYDTEKPDPLLHFQTRTIPFYWQMISSLLSPAKLGIKKSYKPKKDLGIHLEMLGFCNVGPLVFLAMPVDIISRIGEDLYTINACVKLDEGEYFGSFDFNGETAVELEGVIPPQAIERLKNCYNGGVTQIRFADKNILFSIKCELGDKIYENEDEHYKPLWIKEFIK